MDNQKNQQTNKQTKQTNKQIKKEINNHKKKQKTDCQLMLIQKRKTK